MAREREGGIKEGSPYEKKQGGGAEWWRGEELKTSSWWVTRGSNYRDVRGRVLSQSASARSVSEPPRKRGFASAGRSDFQPCFKQRVALHEEREREGERKGEREEGLSERRLCIRVNAMKTSMRMRVRAFCLALV